MYGAVKMRAKKERNEGKKKEKKKQNRGRDTNQMRGNRLRVRLIFDAQSTKTKRDQRQRL